MVAGKLFFEVHRSSTFLEKLGGDLTGIDGPFDYTLCCETIRNVVMIGLFPRVPNFAHA